MGTERWRTTGAVCSAAQVEVEDTFLDLLEAGDIAEPKRPLVPAVRFDISLYSQANAVLDFRFDADTIESLAHYFALPDVVVTEEGYRCTKTEAFALLSIDWRTPNVCTTWYSLSGAPPTLCAASSFESVRTLIAASLQ